MESHFEDAIEDAIARPRMWSVHDADQLVGFVMISDGIPAERRWPRTTTSSARTSSGGC